MILGSIPRTYDFSFQDVKNLTGYDNLYDAENASYAKPVFPGGNQDIGSLLHFRGAYYEGGTFSYSSVSTTVEIRPYSGNRILILNIATNFIRQGGTPTLNGVNFTRSGSNLGNYSTETWYILNPSVGSYTLSIPHTGSQGAIFYGLLIIPYNSGGSLYSSNFNSGNSNSLSIYANAPPGQSSIIIINLICVNTVGCNPSTATYTWMSNGTFHMGSTYDGLFETSQIIIGSQTIGYTIPEGTRIWEISSSVFITN